MEQIIQLAEKRFARPVAHSRLGLVLIDMHDDRSCILPSRGSLEAGIRKVVDVLSAARSMHIPTLLVSMPEYPRIMPELLEAAGPDTRTMMKIYRSCFLDPEFAEIINQFGSGTLVLGGWKRNKCVLAAAEHALRFGFKVMTADDILFRGSEVDDPIVTLSEQGFYPAKTEYYDTAKGLIKAMARFSRPTISDNEATLI